MDTSVSGELIDDLLAKVREVYPGWQGFTDERFLREERQYKVSASVFAQELLAEGQFHELLNAGGHQEILDRVRRVAQKTNLLYLSTPQRGDLAVIERDDLPVKTRAELIFDLLHGPGDTGRRLDRYSSALTPTNLAPRWPLPSYLLLLMNPEKETFVKPSVIHWLQAQGIYLPYQPIVIGQIYSFICKWHRELGVALEGRGLHPLDMIGVQSFLWVAYYAATGAKGPRDEEQEPRDEEVDADDPTVNLGSSATATVPIHADVPAIVDELGRQPFTDILARRIRQTYAATTLADREAAFAVHLHGPWGSGKTSLLNLLDKELRTGEASWVVIRFDAWKHQRIRPPWWPLLREIYQQGKERVSNRFRWKAWRVWWAWKLRASFFPIVLSFLTIAAFSFFLYFISSQPPAEGTAVERLRFDLGAAVSLLGGLASLFGLLQTKNRSILLGSSKAAEAYLELSHDPLGPLTNFFRRLTGSFGRPVAIFIDDLDRCDSEVVVELLEGMQTLFRQASVVYVVAADRDWIRTSFEERYASFVDRIGEPGRPLGHLFLEKMFQVSIRVPRLTAKTRSEYWQRLIVGSEPEEAQQRLVEEGAELLRAARSPDEVQSIVERHRGEAVEAGVRMAAAQKLSTPEGVAATEHFLQAFAPLLEPNPRAMKRLVNAFGLQHAINLLFYLDLPLDALVIWTILEQRWPELASLLCEHPELLENLRAAEPTEDERVPPSVRRLFTSSTVRRVVAASSAGRGLDVALIERLTGQDSETA